MSVGTSMVAPSAASGAVIGSSTCVAASLEERVRRHGDRQVEIAATPAGAASALARHPNPGAPLHAGGDLHVEVTAGPLPAAAVARRAGAAVDVAGAAAGGARLVELEREGLPGAVKGLLERDLDRGLHVLAAPSRRAPIPAAAELLEDVGAASRATGPEVAEDRPEEVREPPEIPGSPYSTWTPPGNGPCWVWAPAAAYRCQSGPSVSYRRRFSGSERTSFASLISLKRSADPVLLFRSGWYFRASRR